MHRSKTVDLPAYCTKTISKIAMGQMDLPKSKSKIPFYSNFQWGKYMANDD